MKTPLVTKIRLLGLATLLVLANFSACNGFLGGDNLKAVIKQEVTVADAASVSLTVQPDPTMEGAGTTSLSVTTQKVGISFSITASPVTQYAFDHWAQVKQTTTDGTISYSELDASDDLYGAVTFGNADSATSTATVVKNVSGIYIQAFFNARPELQAMDPSDNTTCTVSNKAITLYFSEPLKSSTVVLGTTINVYKSSVYGAYAESGNISSNYKLSDISNDWKTLRLTLDTSKATTHPLGYWVGIIVSKKIEDADGNAMYETYKYYFKAAKDATSDTTSPTLNAWSLTNTEGDTLYSDNGSGTIVGSLTSGALVNSNVLNFYIDATDTIGSVADVTLWDTFGAVSSLTSTAPWITESTAIEYDLPDDFYDATNHTFDGSHTVSFYVSDENGNYNKTTGGTSIKLVLDTTPPAISDFYLGASATATTTYYKSKTGVPVHATVVDTNWGVGLGSGSQTSAIAFSQSSGASSSVTFTDITSASTDITSTYDFTSDGTKSLYGYFKDAAGNITEYGPAKITIDTEPPVVSVSSFSSSNALSGYAKGGDTCTLVFKAYDLAAGVDPTLTSGYTYAPAVKIAGVDATVVLTTSAADSTYSGVTDYTFTATATLPSTYTDGAIPYSLTVYDKATAYTTLTQASSGAPVALVFDGTAPKIANLVIVDNTAEVLNSVTATEYTDGVARLTLGAVTEAGSGVASYQYSLDGTTWTSFTPTANVATLDIATVSPTNELKTIYVRATDKAGNCVVTASSSTVTALTTPKASIYLDTTIPTLGAITLADADSAAVTGYTNGDITLTVTAGTEAGSGVASYDYSINGTTWVDLPAQTGLVWTVANPWSGTADGSKTLYVRAVDAVGNCVSTETPSTITAGTTPSGTIYYDITPPAIVSLSVKDTSSSLTAYTDGDVTLTLGAISDNAGSGSGASTYWYSLDKTTWLSLSTYSTTTSTATISGTELGTTNGIKTIYVKATDKLGNTIITASASTTAYTPSSSITLDTLAPTIGSIALADTNGAPVSGYTNGDVTITVNTLVEEGSGLAKYEYRIGASGNWTTLPVASLTATSTTGTIDLSSQTNGSVTVYVRATDNVGLVTAESGCPTASITVDTTAPVFTSWGILGDGPTSSYNPDNRHSKGAMILNGAATETNLYSLQYSLDNSSWTNVTSGASVSLPATGKVYMRIKDKAGNISANSPYRTLYLDTASPTATVSISDTDAVVKNGTSVTVTAAIADDAYLSAAPTFAVTSADGATTLQSATSMSAAGVSITGSAAFGTGCTVSHTSGASTATLTTTAELDLYLSSTSGAKVVSGSATAYAIDGTYATYTTGATLANPLLTLAAGSSISITGMTVTRLDTGAYLTVDSSTATSFLTTANWTASWTVSQTASWEDSVISVSATDLSGNSNTTTSGTTTVDIDNTAPALSSLTVTKNDGTFDGYVKEGDVLSFTVTFSESHGLSSSSGNQYEGITIYGVVDATLTATADPLVWTYSWTAPSGTTYTGASAQAIRVRATDAAGNYSSDLTPSSVSQVYIDNKAPTLSGVSLVDPETAGSTYTDGNPTATVAGLVEASGQYTVYYRAYVNSAYTDWAQLSSNAASGTATLSTDGTTAVYVYIKDKAGNTSSTTDYSASIVMDNTDPALTSIALSDTSTPAVSGYTNDDLTVTLTGASDANGIAGAEYSVGSTSTGTYYAVTSTTASGTTATSCAISNIEANAAIDDGSITVWIRVKDNAGRYSAPVSKTITLDTTGPVVSCSWVGSNSSYPTYTSGPVTATLSTTADSVGTSKLQYSTNGTSWSDSSTMTTTIGTAQAFTSTSLLTTFYVRGVDTLGNVSTTPASQAFTYDGTAPTFTGYTIQGTGGATYPGYTSGSVSLAVSGVTETNLDDAFSYQYTLNGGSTWLALGSSTGSKAISSDATVALRVVDKAGNITYATTGSVTASRTMVYDVMNPSVTFISMTSSNTFNSAYAKNGSTVKLYLALSDTNVVEPTTASVTIGGNAPSSIVADSSVSGANYVATYTFNSTNDSTANGAVAYTVTLSDKAGNSSAITQATTASGITLDRTAPTVEITANKESGSYLRSASGSVSFTATFSESVASSPTPSISIADLSGSAMGETSGTVWTKTWSVPSDTAYDGSTSYTPVIVAYDLAGNAVNATYTSTVSYYVDNVAPTFTLSAFYDTSYYTAKGSKTLGASNGDVTLEVGAASDASGSFTAASTTYTIGSGSATTFTPANGVTATGTITSTLHTASVTVTDAAGNATTHTATLTYDVDGPSLTFVGMASNNSLSSSYAKDGDVVTVYFTASDGASGLDTSETTVTIGAQTATVSAYASTGTSTADDPYYNANYKATHTFSKSGESSVTADGVIAYSISGKDVLGTSSSVSATSGTGITLDRTAPTAVNITVSANSGTSTDGQTDHYVKSADKVYFTGAFTETNGIHSATISVADSARTPVNAQSMTVSGKSATYAWTVPANTGTTVVYDGSTKYTTSVYVTDLAGNTATLSDTQTTAGTDDIYYYIDNEAPAFSISAFYDTSYYTANGSKTLGYSDGGVTLEVGAATDESNGFTAASATYTIGSGTATAFTPSDGVTATGTITSTAYTASVTVTDLAGNATTHTNTLGYDAVGPTFTFVGMASDNTYNSAYARDGDQVTVYFTASDGGSGLDASETAVTIGGQSATIAPYTSTGTSIQNDSYYNANYKATYTFDKASESPVTADGAVAYLISGKDVLGTPSSTSATTGTSITLDRTPPTVAITADTTSGSYLRNVSGDQDSVAFTATFSESVAASTTPTISIADLASSVMDKTSGTVWTKTWAVPSATTYNGAASYTPSIVAHDIAGNELSSITSTVQYHVDNVAPSFTAYLKDASSNSTTCTNGDVALVIAAPTEASAAYTASGCTYTIGGTAHTLAYWLGAAYAGAAASPTGTVTASTNSASVTITDAAGNATTVTPDSLSFDTTPPTVNYLGMTTSNGNSAYAKDSDTVSLYFYTIDNVGGCGLGTATVLIDGRTATVNAYASTGSDTATDSDYDPYYSANFKATYTFSSATEATSAPQDGVISYSVSQPDAVGNTTAVTSADTGAVASGITLDRTAPTVKITADTATGSYLRNVSGEETNVVAFTATFSESVAASTSPTLAIEGLSASTMDSTSGTVWTKSWTVPSGAGYTGDASYTPTVTAKDLAGNALNPTYTSTVLYYVDNVAPSIGTLTLSSTTTGNTSYTNNSITLTLGSVTEAGSGIASYYYTVYSGTIAPTSPAYTKFTPASNVTALTLSGFSEGPLTVAVYAVDALGNSGLSSVTTDAIALDTTGPTIINSDGTNNLTLAYTYASSVGTLTTYATDSSGIYSGQRTSSMSSSSYGTFSWSTATLTDFTTTAPTSTTTNGTDYYTVVATFTNPSFSATNTVVLYRLMDNAGNYSTSTTSRIVRSGSSGSYSYAVYKSIIGIASLTDLVSVSASTVSAETSAASPGAVPVVTQDQVDLDEQLRYHSDPGAFIKASFAKPIEAAKTALLQKASLAKIEEQADRAKLEMAASRSRLASMSLPVERTVPAKVPVKAPVQRSTVNAPVEKTSAPAAAGSAPSRSAPAPVFPSAPKLPSSSEPLPALPPCVRPEEVAETDAGLSRRGSGKRKGLTV